MSWIGRRKIKIMSDEGNLKESPNNGFNVTSSRVDNDEEAYQLDIDRMVNEGLGGGQVTIDNGYVGDIPPEQLIMEREEE